MLGLVIRIFPVASVDDEDAEEAALASARPFVVRSSPMMWAIRTRDDVPCLGRLLRAAGRAALRAVARVAGRGADGFLRPALMRSIAGSFLISIWTDDAVSAGRLLSRQSCPSSVSVSFQ